MRRGEDIREPSLQLIGVLVFIDMDILPSGLRQCACFRIRLKQVHRLHDEIVPITARWTDIETRRESLRPHAEDATEKTLELLEGSAEYNERVHRILGSLSSILHLKGIGEAIGHTNIRLRPSAASVTVHPSLEAPKQRKPITEEHKAKLRESMRKAREAKLAKTQGA